MVCSVTLPTGPAGCRSDRLLGPAALYMIAICKCAGIAIGEMAMAAKTFLTTTAANAMGDNHNSVSTNPHGLVLLQNYRRIEKLTHRAPYKFPMTIVPFPHAVYQPLTLPHALRFSPEQLQFRAELRRLAYGAGMFVLGILAHIAWLSA